jgi:proteasome activator subunit 4
MSPRITQMPEITVNGMESDVSELGSEDIHLSKVDEDSLTRQSTAGFADWIATFFRRVISLLETLPDEMPGDHASSSGNDADGEIGWLIHIHLSETVLASVTDMVLELCEQICVHLSEPLFDLVLTLVYDYATTTVRSNATRCMHALVECVAAANPSKTLAKFIPYCERCISYELDHGASSIRTTSSSTALPADAALHWSERQAISEYSRYS